jgi:hypothetical protein
LVLKHNPKFEALELAYDPECPGPFMLRPAYEYTHASNNLYAARRYPNLLDERAVRYFIEITHEAYWRRLREHFGKNIESLFTDEPSLMAVNIGLLPEHLWKNVRIVDPPDANAKQLPSVPWVQDLPALYQQQYGEDILAVRKSLFEGSGEEVRRVRRQFWALIADLIAQRYFGQIQQWAGAHHIASSGHTLCEESPLKHVPLEGNALEVLGRMDIPGLDMLSSDPETVIHNGWLTASLPASAAFFHGRRKVMTEVSDFLQWQAKQGPASLAQMQATAAWQAAFGVTEFTLYYGIYRRHAEQCRSYCDFVGRLNALLREAQLAPQVLLYYPIYDLWGEYVPVAGQLTLKSQSQRVQHIVGSFMRLGQQMVKKQISFVLVDHQLLADAEVRNADMWIKGKRFSALVLPAGVKLPGPAAEKVNRFKASGGRVFCGLPCSSSPGSSGSTEFAEVIDFNALADIYPSRLSVLRSSTKNELSVQTDRVVIGRFVRTGREILLVVNVAEKPYAAGITVRNGTDWLVADPASGQFEQAKTDEVGRIIITLPPQGAVLLIAPPAPGCHFATDCPQDALRRKMGPP